MFARLICYIEAFAGKKGSLDPNDHLIFRDRESEPALPLGKNGRPSGIFHILHGNWSSKQPYRPRKDA